VNQHISLGIALLLILAFEFYRTLEQNHRNWCGMRLAFPICMQAFFPMFIVTLVYWDIYHTGSAEIDRRYFLLLSFVAAATAHFSFHWITRTFVDPSSSVAEFSLVTSRIAQKRLLIERTLENHPNCKELLHTAIELSNLSPHRKVAFRRRIASTNSKSQQLIFEVIDAVGVTIMKQVMKGAQ
jgi:hypothetical protein